MKFGHSFRTDQWNGKYTPRGETGRGRFWSYILHAPFDDIPHSLSPPSFSLYLSRLSMKRISLSSRTVAVLSPHFGYPFLVIQKPKRNEGLVFSDRYYVILLCTICSSECLHRILIWYSKLSTAPAGVDVGHSGWRWQWHRRHAREQWRHWHGIVTSSPIDFLPTDRPTDRQRFIVIDTGYELIIFCPTCAAISLSLLSSRPCLNFWRAASRPIFLFSFFFVHQHLPKADGGTRLVLVERF
jgi:hypothetical protein